MAPPRFINRGREVFSTRNGGEILLSCLPGEKGVDTEMWPVGSKTAVSVYNRD